MGLLEGKKAVIFGVANDRSIAWAISEAFHAEGAELAFTYAGEIFEKRVRPLAEGIGSKIILPCDVTKDEEIEKVFATLKQEWGGIDILIHAIAFANKEDLSNPYVQTSRAGISPGHGREHLFPRRACTLRRTTHGGTESVDPHPDLHGLRKSHS